MSSKFDADEIRNLAYIEEPFNDPAQVNEWLAMGHQPRGGMLYDMRFAYQPSATQQLIDEWSKEYDHIGISYYKMRPGDNLPYHSDTYKKYIERYGIPDDRKRDIWRYVFFVEDWKPGHILEINGESLSGWHAGDWAAWPYDMSHMAANLGNQDRYTIQLTGLRRR